MKNDNKAKERGSPTAKGNALLLLLKIAFAAMFLLLVFTTIYGLEVTKDDSMKPSIREGDIVLYYRLDKDYMARDLVLVKEGKDRYVRRVIACEGDKVDMNEDGILINGYAQQEDYIYTDTEAMVDGIEYPLTITNGQVFVMGDDRPTSRDSRLYGPVDIKSATKGKVLIVIKRRHF